MHNKPIIDICNAFAEVKKYQFDNELQRQSFYRRNVRAAKNLVGYPMEKIEKVMKYLNETAEYKWTLESVGKYIDENIDKLENKNNYKILDLKKYG